ncbi:MAG: head-tail connector protein [Oscillospiraceae bacterium]|nr:head-tail connector protein [Oscillospiraceae bacterium]
MKISRVKTETIAAHCHAPEDDPMLKVYWDAAVQYVLGYTGMTKRDADKHEDLTVAALVLVSDMYYNRSYHVASEKVNQIVDSIIGSHDYNLLPGGGVDERR